jgi:hypothetical protein
MLPILQIGSFSLRTPGLALLASVWLGLELASRAAPRYTLSPDRIYTLGFSTLAAGVLGARLGFVLLHLSLYTRIAPWTRALGAAFSLSPGTETAWTGGLATLVVFAAQVWRWQAPLLALLDVLAPGAAGMAAGVHLANLLSGAAYGIESSLPWAIMLGGARREPVQAYLMLAAAGAAAAAYRLLPAPIETGKRTGKDKKRRREQAIGHPQGMVTQVTALILGTSTLLFDPLHAASPVIGPGIRVWSVVALLIVVAVLAGFAVRAQPGRTS